jgi:D-alanyl-D-alanine carboxypeptidase/D-alanyl-D-alanine-endopeptidase
MHAPFRTLLLLLLSVIGGFSLSFSPAAAKTVAMQMADDSTAIKICQRVDSLLTPDLLTRSQVGLHIYDLTADSTILAFGADQLMRPASNEKVITAVTALSQLGTDFNFRTSLYGEGSINDSTLEGNIYIKGGFDPRFGHDDLWALIHALDARGVRAIAGDVILDLSLKDSARLGWGWCWDDDNPPLTPLLYNQRDNFAAALSSALKDAGIRLAGSLIEGRISSGASLWTVRTHTIDQVLLRMMKQSDNLYAEALFYQLAARSGIAYADRKQAIAYIKELVRHQGLSPADFSFADGSGLSLYNYASPRLLTSFLRYAYAHEGIFLHLQPSLPLAGVDGTLRKRMTSGPAYANVSAKTGTLEGVSTLSGYCTAPNGHTLCFAIMNQGILRRSVAHRFQDKVCEAMTAP